MAAKKTKDTGDGQGEVYMFPPDEVESSPEQNEVVHFIMRVYRATKHMPTDELKGLLKAVQEHGVHHPDGSHADTFVETVLSSAVEAWE